LDSISNYYLLFSIDSQAQALDFVEMPVEIPARRICDGAQGQPFPEEYNMYATI
jgi:hypothetical protein